MDEGQEESIESLLSKAKKGSGADSAREYFGNYIWAKLWRAVTNIANCPPEFNALLAYRAEISVCMKLAQEIQLAMADAEIAIAKLKELMTARPKI